MFDRNLRNLRVDGVPGPVDIGITGGLIRAMAPDLPSGAPCTDYGGRFAFTPFGNASLLRMANLYANVAQRGGDDAVCSIVALISDEAAVLAGIGPCRLRAGGPANLVVLDAPDPVTALRGICRPLEGWRAGRRSFRNPSTELCRPAPS